MENAKCGMMNCECNTLTVSALHRCAENGVFVPNISFVEKKCVDFAIDCCDNCAWGNEGLRPMWPQAFGLALRLDLLAKLLRHVVEETLAAVGREFHAACHHLVPLLGREPLGEVVACDAVFEQEPRLPKPRQQAKDGEFRRRTACHILFHLEPHP